MSSRKTTGQRISIKGVAWKRSRSISAPKYAQVSKAILTSLGATPITFTELTRRVRKKLTGFEGSVPWYTISVARELESQRKIIRHKQPVLYSKAGRTRGRGSRSDARR